MTTEIDKTAIIKDGAVVEDGVFVGPFCTVDEKVVLKKGVKLRAHVCVTGETVVGENTQVYPFAVLGCSAQHTKFMGEQAKLTIGKDNIIREHVTMHTGTPIEKSETIIGNNGFFMVGSHVAHDCVIGDNVIMTNNSALGGHVRVGDFAIIGGLSAVHQFCRIGKYAMIGGMSGVEQDVIPYGLLMGDRGKLRGLNLVGLKRHNFSLEQINEMRRAYRMLFANEGTFAERVEDVAAAFKGFQPVEDIIAFIKEDSHRMICQAGD